MIKTRHRYHPLFACLYQRHAPHSYPSYACDMLCKEARGEGALLLHLPCAEHGRSDNGSDPVNVGVRRPAEDEEADGDEEGTADGGRQAELGLAAADGARVALEAGDEAVANVVPEGVGGRGEEHADEDAHEGEADLPEIEAVDVAEDEGEGAEEEIEDAEEDGGEEAEVEDHGLEDEELEGTLEGDADCADDGLVSLLHGGFPAVVAGFAALLDGFGAEDDGVWVLVSPSLG